MKKNILAEKNRQGITLIEVLIATCIFIIAVMAIFTAFHAHFYLCQTSRESLIALNDLETMVENIYSEPFASLSIAFPNGTANGSSANPYWNIVGGYELAQESITVTYPTFTNESREILVSLIWRDKAQRLQRMAIATYRSE